MDQWTFEPARDHGLAEPDRWKSLRRESGLISSGLHVACWGLIRTYLALRHRLKIVGSDHVPAEPPFVLVANHASHLDALVLAAHLPWRLRDRVFPIAAGDVFFDRPVKSAFSAMMLNALPMWRKGVGPQAMRQLRQRLVEEPCAFILFPEGGRSRDGALMPFRTGLGMLVAQTDVPVVPCYLHGCFEAMRAGRWLPRGVAITQRIGPPLRFSDVPNDRGGWERVVEEVRAAVVRLGG